MKRNKSIRRFALCLDNTAYPASLERWKIYRLLTDVDASANRQVRVVDESGEDYLYPREYFKIVALSPSLARLHGRAPRALKGRAAIRAG
jgi:hypothetical protein